MEASSTRPSVKLDSDQLAVIVNGLIVTTAPAAAELYAVLGEPTRVVSAGGAAPPGLRNNQIHVYDHLGIRLNEHHHTFRIQELACSFECQEPLFSFAPHSPFAGELWIDAVRLPAGGPISSFVDRCPIPLAHHLAAIGVGAETHSHSTSAVVVHDCDLAGAASSAWSSMSAFRGRTIHG
jgi:hypothetical protein